MTQTILEQLDSHIATLARRRAAILLLQPQIDAIGLAPELCGEYLDYNHLPHSDVILVISGFGGKWTKTLQDEGRINYVRDEQINGLNIRCWYGQPPPNCQIIEEEVDVPEEIRPAHKEIRRRLVCPQA